MNDAQQNTWYTGDWDPKGNNLQAPYNGVKIVAMANYAQQKDSQISGDLASVDLQIVDYTYDPDGVSSAVQLTKSTAWYDIPVPNQDFSIAGLNNNTLGLVKLDVMPSGIFLSIQFSYGLIAGRREEMGYIMRFSNQAVDLE